MSCCMIPLLNLNTTCHTAPRAREQQISWFVSHFSAVESIRHRSIHRTPALTASAWLLRAEPFPSPCQRQASWGRRSLLYPSARRFEFTNGHRHRTCHCPVPVPQASSACFLCATVPTGQPRRPCHPRTAAGGASTRGPRSTTWTRRRPSSHRCYIIRAAWGCRPNSKRQRQQLPRRRRPCRLAFRLSTAPHPLPPPPPPAAAAPLQGPALPLLGTPQSWGPHHRPNVSGTCCRRP